MQPQRRDLEVRFQGREEADAHLWNPCERKHGLRPSLDRATDRDRHAPCDPYPVSETDLREEVVPPPVGLPGEPGQPGLRFARQEALYPLGREWKLDEVSGEHGQQCALGFLSAKGSNGPSPP